VGVMRKGDTGTPEPLAKPRPRGRALGGPVGEIGKQARRMCPLPKKGSCGAIAERRALALGTSKEGMHMSSRVPSGLRRWSRSPQGALCHGWAASAAIIGYRKCTVGVSAACAAYVRGESLGLGRDWRSCLALVPGMRWVTWAGSLVQHLTLPLRRSSQCSCLLLSALVCSCLLSALLSVLPPRISRASPHSAGSITRLVSTSPCASSQRSASIAARQPSPAAVTACR